MGKPPAALAALAAVACAKANQEARGGLNLLAAIEVRVSWNDCNPERIFTGLAMLVGGVLILARRDDAKSKTA